MTHDDRDRRHVSPHDNGDRYRDRERDRYGDPVPRLSAEDIKRYEFLQRRREERERELSDLSLQVKNHIFTLNFHHLLKSLFYSFLPSYVLVLSKLS